MGTLVKLAQSRFDDLTPIEIKFFEAVEAGKTFNCRTGKDNNDPTNADAWGPERVLRAGCIAWLCTDLQAADCITHLGVQLAGVRVKGVFDLNFATLHFPLVFSFCALPEGATLKHAVLASLNLHGTHAGPISADGLTVHGNVFLRRGFKAEGEVRLLGATIGGNLNCTNGHFSNPGENKGALIADEINVNGNVLLDGTFKAEGEVRFIGATIGGQLNCAGGRFSNPEGCALNLGEAHVKRGVYLRNAFKAEGEVRLVGAIIGMQFNCTDAQFSNPAGNALSADQITVKGSVFLRGGFQAKGEVRLVGATIGGQLDCTSGKFSNAKGYALTADGIDVKNDIFMRNGFKAEGYVSLVSAKVTSQFIWAAIELPKTAELDLRHASLGKLGIANDSYPDQEKLHLNGLIYESFGEDTPVAVASLIALVRRQSSKRHLPQPYEQLASVLRNDGRREDAITVLIAKIKDPARLKQFPWWKKYILHHLSGILYGHGYRPWNAIIAALLIVIISWCLFTCGQTSGTVTAIKLDAQITAGGIDTVERFKDYPAFDGFLYSLDVFLPVVNLHQTEYWMPNANRNSKCWLVSGAFLRYWMCFEIIAGWILTTLLAVSLTRRVRA